MNLKRPPRQYGPAVYWHCLVPNFPGAQYVLAFLNVSSNVKLHTVKVGKYTCSSYMHAMPACSCEDHGR